MAGFCIPRGLSRPRVQGLFSRINKLVNKLIYHWRIFLPRGSRAPLRKSLTRLEPLITSRGEAMNSRSIGSLASLLSRNRSSTVPISVIQESATRSPRLPDQPWFFVALPLQRPEPARPVIYTPLVQLWYSSTGNFESSRRGQSRWLLGRRSVWRREQAFSTRSKRIAQTNFALLRTSNCVYHDRSRD